MLCKKCDGPGTLSLRRNDVYCDECFLSNINHKFRACIGKNKSVPANVKVLLCLSGGSGSGTLLDFVRSGISLDNHKKLRISPIALHLITNSSDEESFDNAQNLINICKRYNIDICIAHISEFYESNQNFPAINCLPKINSDLLIKFDEMITSLSPSACNDIMLKVKRDLYIRYAKFLECNYIFTGDTTQTLAINLLSNIVIGRGSQVEHDIGFSDTRDKTVTILKPMKDITKEELDCYVKIKQLKPINVTNTTGNSLQAVIGTFINDLQDNFPATISTVCKTADKLGEQNEKHVNENKCVFCKGTLDTKDTMTALEATSYSRVISSRNCDTLQGNLAISKNDFDKEVVDESIFPFIHKHFCYACSRNYAEINNHGHRFPEHIQETIK